jgi:hypothetical protein
VFPKLLAAFTFGIGQCPADAGLVACNFYNSARTECGEKHLFPLAGRGALRPLAPVFGPPGARQL